MAQYPPWKEMTPDQKFDFLNEWCENLSRSIRVLEEENHSFHARLRAVEDACKRMDVSLRTPPPRP
jgi:hypothetical protein